MISEKLSQLDLYDFENFDNVTLKIHSQALKNNPLQDPHIRRHPILQPKGDEPKEGFPVVLLLAGYGSNGSKNFAWRSFEQNEAQRIDSLVSEGKAPRAHYVFVDNWTFWGGSQFINSEAVGQYEDHLVQELVPALRQNFNLSKDPRFWCVCGGSSGGYGALHLASRHPHLFGLVAAQAPDSFFEASLLPEIYGGWPYWKALGGLEGLRQELLEGRLLQKRYAHRLLNVVAMGLCYAPVGKKSFAWPIEEPGGQLLAEVWRRWKFWDPLEFLPRHQEALKQWAGAYLDVGERDQFNLQFGARQIRDLLVGLGVSLSYSEFAGDHFDLGSRRPEMWSWLNQQWS